MELYICLLDGRFTKPVLETICARQDIKDVIYYGKRITVFLVLSSFYFLFIKKYSWWPLDVSCFHNISYVIMPYYMPYGNCITSIRSTNSVLQVIFSSTKMSFFSLISKMNTKKCVPFQWQQNFLGHMVTAEGNVTIPDKIRVGSGLIKA